MTEPERPITRYCIHCGGIVEFAFLHGDLDEDMIVWETYVCKCCGHEIVRIEGA